MPCYHPFKAFRSESGEVVFAEKHARGFYKTLELPCGQCVGCRLERSRQWAMRCVHEASLYKDNCFITLTYDPANLPPDLSLHYEHYQLFMKRLRKRFPKNKIRFYMAGEYGTKFGRPHYHACIFNFNFSDRVYYRTTEAGSRIDTSAELSKLWPYGFSSVGDLTFESAAYCARYIMAKITGDLAEFHYQHCDLSTGEIINRTPEFNHMSLKPGIGNAWFQKYKDDVYPFDEVIVNGKAVKPPKYYDKLLKELDNYEFDDIMTAREFDATRRAKDNTRDRLKVREAISKARMSRFERSLT